MLVALLGFHAVTAALAPLLARRIGRSVFLVCAFPPAAAVLYALAAAPALLDQRPVRGALPLAPSLGLAGSLHLDAFALLMVALVSGIGVLVLVYAYASAASTRANPGTFAGALTGLSGAMLGLVLSDDLLVLLLFWVLASVTGPLLVGFQDRRAEVREAARRSLLTAGAGVLALLGGVVLVGRAAGASELSALAGSPPQATAAVSVGLVLVLLGAFTQSAQGPFHTWLPAAAAGPATVSAHLHATTTATAGVYLVARLAPIFATVGVWRPLVVLVGVATLVVGGYRATRQVDLVLLVAYGAVGQLGLMLTLFGLGTPHATFAGTAMLLAHGVVTAALFMVVGVVERTAGTRDVRLLAGAGTAMPVLVGAGAVAAASLAGLPPLLGFRSRGAAFDALLRGDADPWVPLALLGIVLGSVLTVALSARFVAGTLGRLTDPTVGTPVTAAAIQRPSSALVLPAALLAALSLLLGLLPLLVEPLLNHAASALDPGWEARRLVLWPGLGPVLGLSALAVCAGAALHLARGPVARLHAAVPAVPDPRSASLATVKLLAAAAPNVATATRHLRPLAALRFVVYLLAKLVESTAVVVREVASPSQERAGIVAVPVTGVSDAVMTLVANATSLLPGTLTVAVRRDPATLYVHVLHLRSVEATRDEVLNLTRLALAAFGSPEAIAEAREVRRALRARPPTRRTSRPTPAPARPADDPGGGDR